jgi:N-acetylmuramoyl-L-alanine amidase CwlA
MAFTINKYHGKYNIANRTSTVKYIVVHYTAGTGSARNNCIYFSNGNRNASAHYFIDDDSIYEYADPKAYATWHCGDGGGKYGITNANSIGIEVVNTGNAFSEAEIEKLAWLVQKLMADFNVPADRVVRHYDASRKSCPAYYVKNSAKWTELHARITTGKAVITPAAKPTPSTQNKITYRVRKKWNDAKSQLGAYSVLANAKAIVDKNPGYSVFDNNGKVVYPVAKPATPTTKLEVDGYWGPATTKALQKALGTTVDGIISGQASSDFNKVNKGGLSTSTWKIGKGGSNMVRALQKKLGISADGYFGPATCKALQKYLGTYVDGYVDGPSGMVKALQKKLNSGKF